MANYPTSTGYNPNYRDALIAQELAKEKSKAEAMTEAEAYVEPRYRPYEQQPTSTPEADALAIRNAREQYAIQKMNEMQANLAGAPEGVAVPPGFKESAIASLKFVEPNRFHETATPSLRFNNFDNEYERLSTLADLVIKGKMGSGASRKKNLGADYAKVQKIVNSRLKGKKDPVYELIVANAMGGA